MRKTAKTKTISVRLTEADYKVLSVFAKNLGMTTSRAVRLLVDMTTAQVRNKLYGSESQNENK